MKLMIWSGVAIAASFEVAATESVRNGAERVLARANEHVPFREGTLEESGTVTVDGSEAAISYATAYAARLHQNPQYHFQGKGRGHWLVDAINADKGDTLAVMAKPFRDALGRFAKRPV